MKILVTGHRGFIGQNMLKALSNHSVATYEWGDARPNIVGLDWVVHLGAISSTTERDVDKVMRQNYDFSRWLLLECAYHEVNFQYSSSASVYGLNQNFTEDAPANPMSPYAWSKYLFDRYVAAHTWSEIQVQGFRYFNVYGPHEDHKGNQASPQHQFAKQAQETGVIKLFENSHQYHRDFVPVETVIDVHKTFFDVAESGIWNVGTGRTQTFEQVGRAIADQYAARIEYIAMPESVKNQYQTYTCADLTKLKMHYDKDNS
jgi:ADP-L-glycero-D-manno-heptose 6-epimerase